MTLPTGNPHKNRNRTSIKKRLVDLDAYHTARLNLVERSGILRTLAVLFARSGDSWFWLLGLALMWFTGTDFWKARATALIAGVLFTAVLVLLIKFSVRRRRPEGEWGNIYRTTDPHSFPSGHAARAAMLSVMALGMGPTWFGLLVLIWAPFVPLARVAMGIHYLSDVIAGALFGIAMGLITLYLYPLLMLHLSPHLLF